MAHKRRNLARTVCPFTGVAWPRYENLQHLIGVSLPDRVAIVTTNVKLLPPFEKHLPLARIGEIDRLGQSIITVHSHPGGKGQFSKIDDRNDKELFASVNARFNDTRINGAAIMSPGRAGASGSDIPHIRTVKLSSLSIVQAGGSSSLLG